MVDVIGKAKVIVETAVDKSSLDTTSGTIGAGIKKGAVIGVAALGTLTVGAVKAFQAFEEAEASSRKLNNVLGNMGEAKNTAGVEKLASDLSRLTGIDDEVIKGGQTILATFSEVAESAGDIGGTFERATQASVDLAAAGFGTVESASVMLGKALQDPEKGMTALSKAGVTFSESQKEQIAGFLEVNDLASAQAIILGEVEKQVKGTAEANATESAKIATAWGEVQEAIGGALAELTGGEVDSFSEALLEMADSIENLAESEGWEKTGEFLRDLNRDVKDSETFLGQWADSNRESGKSLLDLAGYVEDTGGRIGTMLEGAQEDWGRWASKVGEFIGNVIDDLKEYIEWQSRVGDEVKAPGNTVSATAADRGRAVGGPAVGWTLVGERGPEILNLPAGSYVNSNINSEGMLANSKEGDFIYAPQYYGPQTSADRLLDFEWVYRWAPRNGAPSAVRAS